MMHDPGDHDHNPAAIARRLEQGARPSYVADAVLGGIDGCVTTFAIVAGSLGAGFSPTVAVVLGVANLLADGFSMAVSNFQAGRAEEERHHAARAQEEDHIRRTPEGEREEIRQIFAAKGFKGEVLDQIVTTITGDHELWIRTMLVEEHGLPERRPDPYASALTTFLAFVAVGAVPLLPFLAAGLDEALRFGISAGLAGVMFFLIGLARSRAFGRPIWRSAFSTLFTGSAAAAIAFIVGYGLRAVFGV